MIQLKVHTEYIVVYNQSVMKPIYLNVTSPPLYDVDSRYDVLCRTQLLCTVCDVMTVTIGTTGAGGDTGAMVGPHRTTHPR